MLIITIKNKKYIYDIKIINKKYNIQVQNLESKKFKSFGGS